MLARASMPPPPLQRRHMDVTCRRHRLPFPSTNGFSFYRVDCCLLRSSTPPLHHFLLLPSTGTFAISSLSPTTHAATYTRYFSGQDAWEDISSMVEGQHDSPLLGINAW